MLCPSILARNSSCRCACASADAPRLLETEDMTEESWSGPMTQIFALGHMNRNRGENWGSQRSAFGRYHARTHSSTAHPVVPSSSRQSPPGTCRTATHPYVPPRITVNLGTFALATALTIFAPSFAIPPFSAFSPTIYPEMLTRNTSGICR